MKAKNKPKDSSTPAVVEPDTVVEPATVGEPATDGEPATVDGRLFELYLARVAQVDTVHTVRRDIRKMFEIAFDEAVAALEVFEKQTTKGETNNG